MVSARRSSVMSGSVSHAPHKAILKKPAGASPDFELTLAPGWLVFSADEHYRKAQYAHFIINNLEPVPMVYRIRTKERSFPQFSHCHGYLPANGSDEVTILITARDHWPREVCEIAGRRHKILIENLTVPPFTTPPLNPRAASELARLVFFSTPGLTRMYCKLNVILPKVTPSSTTSSAGSMSVEELSKPV